ncbi:MAG: enoyl-CoA hydratase/isomerase family protein [Proteobacteria bacterium]|nr:enoyl-CoA hydratase/isomerase family protein [Pseudomonadota bacterium]
MKASPRKDTVVEDGLFIDEGRGFVHVTLDRPEALNALSHPMILGLRRILREESARTILVTGAGGKAFCAGGDIKAQVNAIKGGDRKTPHAYFKDEYGLNADLYHHKGHYVSYLNGITMGGGYGVSAHGSHIVATEATQFAMPEVKIGFFPDVGAVYHLARLPHELGTYLALTGNTIGPVDLMYTGLAEAFIPLDAFDRMKAALDTNSPDDVLPSLHISPSGTSILEQNQDLIAQAFAYSNVEEILDALAGEGSAFANQAAADIRARAPISVKVALAHIRMAARDDFDTVIARDVRLSAKFLESPDFAEGVRAAIIDKDKNPRWKPASLAEVSDEIVALYLNS